jgi:hypothetical protein
LLLDDQGIRVRFMAEAEIRSLLHNVQLSVQRVLGLFPAVKRLKREGNYPLLSSNQVNNARHIHFPYTTMVLCFVN